MDASIKKGLSDRQYSRRKDSALGIENAIRKAKESNDWDKIEKIIDELCDDYAYAVHQPYARNGGLIGLAAASIALEQDVAPYLEKVIPPVLACFSDQDARVRYYACESMYNIAKTCKGELLPWFNEIFDALSKLSADGESSVKNGAELLDRLIKDIISTSATSYVSILQTKDHPLDDEVKNGQPHGPIDPPVAFSLQRFIPLLQERILVNNSWTRMFLVQWIRLLDEIPDLELVSYLPSFLAGLFRFLKDSTQDVVTATQQVLDNFLREIKAIAKVKRDLSDAPREPHDDATSVKSSDIRSVGSKEPTSEAVTDDNQSDDETAVLDDQADADSVAINSNSEDDLESATANEEWLPGQGVEIDYAAILEILVTFIRDSDETVQLTVLRWIDSFFDICPHEIISFVPTLLNKLLPALSSDIERVQQAASRVNSSLMDYIISLPEDEEEKPDRPISEASLRLQVPRNGTNENAPSSTIKFQGLDGQQAGKSTTIPDADGGTASTPPLPSLDYEASVSSLTLQFLNEHEATRVAALSWLIMLQQKAPEKVLAAHDGSFPALLKTLSDTSDAVVTRDLQLLCQISRNSDDSYFTFFMVNLLKLFCTDRRLLENRGNLIIRQLCVTLGPERIYRIMADCLEKDEDVEFASIMVQNLNNNLITAPELADLRRKLRSWDSRDGQTLFVTLFRAWSHNAVATIALCLLAQTYEQAYHLLQIFADIEMSLNMLVQIDKLVQLIESPVFVYLRLQLLEPERYPYLYKTLYGILMLLPQSAAFAALKNRLNSVSAIGYLHVPRPTANSSSSTSSSTMTSNRKSRDDSANTGAIKWVELLDKFRATQDRARRASRGALAGAGNDNLDAVKAGGRHNGRQALLGSADGTVAAGGSGHGSVVAGSSRVPVSGLVGAAGTTPPGVMSALGGFASRQGSGGALGAGSGPSGIAGTAAAAHKSRLSASHLGRLAMGMNKAVGKSGQKK